MDTDNLVGLVAILCIFGLPIVAVIVLIVRLTSKTSKERLEMIKRGMIPPEKVEENPNRLKTLRTGMGAIGCGVGAILGILIVQGCFQEIESYMQLVIILSLIALCYGIAFTIYYVISGKEMEDITKKDE